ncbi:unnamed protein product [Larinioides sclopetarius]|uniref:Uncharacterized protein n=1 Tax=Larinioides sclopetarius TaxID=280406 RepID=A0AAV2A5U7_9ARAC
MIHYWADFVHDQADGVVAVPLQIRDQPLSLVLVGMERRCVLNSWSNEEVRAVIRYEWVCEVSGAEIHNHLMEVYGLDVMTKEMVPPFQ